MSAELLRPPERLIGKSMLEVVSLLPTFPLFTELELSEIEPKGRVIILNLVEYKLGIHDEPDVFSPIDAFQGEEIDLPRIPVNPVSGYATGLVSRIFFARKGYLSKDSAQIPMMDFDVGLKGRSEFNVAEIIKRNLRQMAVMREGLILRSSEGHFHFLGTDMLLTESQFLTFLGMCGLMRDEDGKALVDERFIFHALTSLKRTILAAGRDDTDIFIYKEVGGLYPQVFATLKVKSGEPGAAEPTVIDVL